MSEQNLVKLEDAIKDKSLVVVNKYIPFMIKKNIVNSVLEICVSTNEETGFKEVDHFLKRLAIDYAICNNATNIYFGDTETITTYDELCKSGLKDYIFEQLDETDDDYRQIKWIVDETIEDILKTCNGIEGTIYRCLDKLISKIPDEKSLSKIIKELPKSINKIDPGKLSFLSQAIGFNHGFDVNKIKDGVK